MPPRAPLPLVPRIARGSALIAALLLASACSDALGGGKKYASGLHIVSGADVTDTIEATGFGPLIVRAVGENGRPLENAEVDFDVIAIPSTRPPQHLTWTMQIAPGGNPDRWAVHSVEATNADGLARVYVRMDTLAGPAGVIIRLPAVGLVDTAHYTVLPGHAVGVSVTPPDTAIFVGNTISLGGVVQDRHHNARPEPVTFTSASNRVTIAGHQVTGAAVGRVEIRAAGAGLLQTSALSIVPHGTLAAYTSALDGMALWVLGVDGSGMHRLVPTIAPTGYFGEMPGVWSRDGASVIYHDNHLDHTRRLWIADAANGAAHALATADNTLPNESWPAVAPDGAWIYFNGPDPADYVYHAATLVYRIHPDGTGTEHVGPDGVELISPSVSPDGRRLVGTTRGQLQLLDIASRTLTPLGVSGSSPAWSPAADVIAYLPANEGAIRAIRADGSNDHQVSASTGYVERLSWSPDGNYLIAPKVGGRLVVIDAATGEEMPIRITVVQSGLWSPAWKP